LRFIAGLSSIDCRKSHDLPRPAAVFAPRQSQAASPGRARLVMGGSGAAARPATLRQINAPAGRRSSLAKGDRGLTAPRVSSTTSARPRRRPREGQIMTIMSLLLLAAVSGVIGSLIMGITAMATDGPVGHRSSAQWMTMRVIFQGVALALVLLTLFG
jgi:Hypoxia induced protein conserved region